VAAVDPFPGDATARHAHLPGAVRVLDAFHAKRLGLPAFYEIRRRIQQDTLVGAGIATARSTGPAGCSGTPEKMHRWSTGGPPG
jgi:hypothetical protein